MSQESSARFWAKTGPNPGLYHPLIAHSADVAAVFEAATEPGTALFQRLSTAAGPDADVDRLRRVLIYLAALHDLGKAHHGFQDQSGPWARPERRWPGRGHVIPVIEAIRTGGTFLKVGRVLANDLPLESDGAEDALLTAIAHHGRPWNSDPQKRAWCRSGRDIWAPDPESGRDPLAEVARLRDYALRWSGMVKGADPLPWNPAISNLFAGLLTVSDWAGSTESIFLLTPDADEDPDRYWEVMREKARRVVRQVGLRPSRISPLPEGEVYRRLFPMTFRDHEPTILQQLIVDIDLPAPGTRLVIESETGSGKTEAAIALYARLRAAGRVDGLVFALPSRATAKAMYDRIRDCLPRLHPDGATPTLALAMGGQVGGASGEEGLELDPELYPDPEDEARHAWASDNHKKFFAAEVVVGTVDQVLLAGLPVKHAHLRLALLARHLIVVDEIHSYDRYMNAILNRVLHYHSSVGGVSAFLSATLSRGARNSLTSNDIDLDADQLPEAINAPYPALSTYDPRVDAWKQIAARTVVEPKRVAWRLGSQTEMGASAFDEAMRVAGAGGRVCILRNTVGEARATVAALRAVAPECVWHPPGVSFAPAYHSRFTPGDRHVLDREVLADFGKGSNRRGVILVATQVVEQSLDVDFDWMMTDLAPVDVLLQRIGRLHRHARPERPSAAKTPRLLVQGPAEPFPPRKEYRGGKFGWGTVYGEVSDLELTRRLIVDRPNIAIPRDNRLLVEHVYHADARGRLAEAEPEWAEALDAAEGRRLGLDYAGGMGALDLGRGYSEQTAQFDRDNDGGIRTRIGDDRISVALDTEVRGWYDRESRAREVPLRRGQLHRAGVTDFLEPTAYLQRVTDNGPEYLVGEKLRIRYGPDGWVEIRD
ncbi:MAG: CRISPR-associated helicase Cas3' [Longimicrobiales bacterium]